MVTILSSRHNFLIGLLSRPFGSGGGTRAIDSRLVTNARAYSTRSVSELDRPSSSLQVSL